MLTEHCNFTPVSFFLNIFLNIRKGRPKKEFIKGDNLLFPHVMPHVSRTTAGMSPVCCAVVLRRWEQLLKITCLTVLTAQIGRSWNSRSQANGLGNFPYTNQPVKNWRNQGRCLWWHSVRRLQFRLFWLCVWN